MNNPPQILLDFVWNLGISPSVITLLLEHPYILIFLGLLLGGETVLLPALYLGVIGILNNWQVLLIMIVATVISDSIWYSIGRGIVPNFIKAILNEKRNIQLAKLSDVMADKELVILFYSKFIYGTRIASQILCGARRVGFIRYILVDVLAVTALGVVYYLLVYFSVTLTYSLIDSQYTLLIVIALVATIIAIIHLSVHNFVRKKWYR